SGSAAPTPSPSGSAAPTAKPAPSGSSHGDAKAAAPSPSATHPAVGPAAPAQPSPTPSATAPASPSPSASAAPGAAATGKDITPLADVKAKLGTDLYTFAQGITDPSQVQQDPTALAKLAPFSKLSAADVAALPPAMQFAIPTISCAQLNGRVAGVL